MRLLTAMMKHETNTFSPVPTPLERFSRGDRQPPEGEAAVAAFRGTGTALGAFIEAAEARGADLVCAIAGSAAPSSPVPDAVFEHFCERILAAAHGGFDGVLLDLHGAMVTQSFEDGEGELLRRLRARVPDTPIGVALDMHTNLYDAMLEAADVLGGYQTYPHVDHHGTGMRVARALLAMIDGRARPVMVGDRRPMLPHVMRQSSEDFPNSELQRRCIAMEADGAMVASVFTGFPHADIRDAGLSAVVVTDGDDGLARRYCEELLDFAWREREAFVYHVEPLAESLKKARHLAAAAPADAGPVILLDHYDNCASGGTMDTMTVLSAIIDAALEDVAVFAIHDPQAVASMMAAGIGAEVELALGGRSDMPSIGLRGEPRTVRGRVKLLSDGRYHNDGPIQPGVRMDMGPSAVLDTGAVQIVVISRHQEPSDLQCLRSLGIDPLSRRYLMLKSRVHFRAAFKPIAHAIVECAGTGVCTSDYDTLRFEKVRRPIFPLDRD